MTTEDFESSFEQRDAGFTISADVRRIGGDILVSVHGGDVPHIGAVVMFAEDGPLRIERFPSHHGRLHHDHVLAERIAEVVRPQVSGTCTITAGVHVDHITRQQIAAAVEMSQRLGESIATWLQTHPASASTPIYQSPEEPARTAQDAEGAASSGFQKMI
jgi:gallate decarboxylase subunit D